MLMNCENAWNFVPTLCIIRCISWTLHPFCSTNLGQIPRALAIAVSLCYIIFILPTIIAIVI